MGAAAEDDVLELARLRRECLVQLRMGVAVNVDPPGGNAVEDAAAVFGVEVHALGAHDGQRRRGSAHLGVRVPDASAIAISEGLHCKNSRSRPWGSNSV